MNFSFLVAIQVVYFRSKNSKANRNFGKQWAANGTSCLVGTQSVELPTGDTG